MCMAMAENDSNNSRSVNQITFSVNDTCDSSLKFMIKIIIIIILHKYDIIFYVTKCSHANGGNIFCEVFYFNMKIFFFNCRK